MAERFAITLDASGQIHDLARVVDVLARLDLTPLRLSIRERAGVWRGVIKIETTRQVAALCAERLRNQITLTSVVARGADGAELTSC